MFYLLMFSSQLDQQREKFSQIGDILMVESFYYVPKISGNEILVFPLNFICFCISTLPFSPCYGEAGILKMHSNRTCSSFEVFVCLSLWSVSSALFCI